MKREKRLTKKERRAISPSAPQQHSHHIHCIACGRHMEPEEFQGTSPRGVYLTCDHKSQFPSCTDCQVTARYLIAEHDRTGKAVNMAQAWH